MDDLLTAYTKLLSRRLALSSTVYYSPVTTNVSSIDR